MSMSTFGFKWTGLGISFLSTKSLLDKPILVGLIDSIPVVVSWLTIVEPAVLSYSNFNFFKRTGDAAISLIFIYVYNSFSSSIVYSVLDYKF